MRLKTDTCELWAETEDFAGFPRPKQQECIDTLTTLAIDEAIKGRGKRVKFWKQDSTLETFLAEVHTISSG